MHQQAWKNYADVNLRPLRLSIRDKINGVIGHEGFLIGLLFDDKVRWFDAFIFVGMPEKVICFEIQDSDIIDEKVVHRELAGAVCIPKKVRLALPQVFGGRPVCLFDILYESTDKVPHSFVYCERSSVIVGDTNWHCVFSDTFILHRAIDYYDNNLFTRRTAPKGKQNLHRLEKTLFRHYFLKMH